MAQPNIKFQYEGLIWKLRLDEQEKVLVAEIRNEVERKVFFSGIDLNLKKKIWEYISQEEWWVSLQEANFNTIILHKLRGYENPQIKGLEVLQSRTGRLLKSIEDQIPVVLKENELILRNASHSDQYSILNFLTDKITPVEFSEITDVGNKTSIHYPLKYSPDNPYYSRLKDFILDFTGLNAQGFIEYLEIGSQIIFSFYAPEGEKNVNYLYVVDENGNILLKEVLGRDLKGYASETFFLSNDLLIFVKDKKELRIFEIQI